MDNTPAPTDCAYSTEPIARDAQSLRARHAANRVAWNQGAARYTAELEETIAFIRGGGSNLHPIERTNLGDLRLWRPVAIHLQCASGCDTLSLWNEGAQRVVGVDISIELFGEYPDDYWDSFPNLRPEFRGRITMTFAMLARRPAK